MHIENPFASHTIIDARISITFLCFRVNLKIKIFNLWQGIFRLWATLWCITWRCPRVTRRNTTWHFVLYIYCFISFSLLSFTNEIKRKKLRVWTAKLRSFPTLGDGSSSALSLSECPSDSAWLKWPKSAFNEALWQVALSHGRLVVNLSHTLGELTPVLMSCRNGG